MIKNYLRIALRNLLKNRIATIINIGGLSVGIAVAILTGLWLHDELSFDTYHDNYNRIAKVSFTGTDKNHGSFISSTLSYPLANEISVNYKDNFKRLVRATAGNVSILSAGEKKVSRIGRYMDEEAPNMFTLKMVKGSRNGLRDMHSILISASTSEALFGNVDPIGKSILINNKTNVTVTGVYEDLPLNTELTKTKFISPFILWVSENDWIEKRATNDWMNHFMKLFAEIKPGTSFESVNSRIENVEIEHIKNVDDENYRQELSINPKVILDPMPKWHLEGSDRRGNRDPAVKRMVWLVSLIGAFVLLLACINFMNLSTARSEKRAKEVGIRKAIGSMRKQLILQFFSESLIIVAIAFVFAMLLTMASLNWFNQLSGKDMHIPWGNPFFWAASVLFIFITGFIAGSYPALYLSSFKPLKALKGNWRPGPEAAIPRKVLVVFQFAISVALINCTIIIMRQVQHAKDRPVGYSRDGLIMINMRSDDFYGNYDVFREELLRTNVVADFAESMGKVTELASNNGGFDWQGRDPDKEQNYGTLAISRDYGRTVGWQVTQGRDFSRERDIDSSGLIINESAMKEMGIDDPIGKEVTWTWWMDNSQLIKYTIIGVVKDMVVESPYEPTRPILYYRKGNNGGVSWMFIKVKPTVAMSAALPKIEAVMKKLVPSAPFDYQFADEDYAQKFASEERISKLAGFFAALAIFISSLGLFGLASFTAEQRTKEIGVRKVLGASTAVLWKLLSGEFMLLVMISLLIAIPVSYYFMHRWMENFQYRATLPAWLFIISSCAALSIALVTISLQTIKAALANPINSLRTE
ncbi:ABC transporter permease [Danxiaibacter flavus]|uniref:ABC transporter permease n=1 Tax=Danxiaibacter flavus TaxID=3049108 RepID=A0ABV3ZJB1_9BACT|nr:ABC transporter permease [Chitinophagaceae bacterium DXS]